MVIATAIKPFLAKLWLLIVLVFSYLGVIHVQINFNISTNKSSWGTLNVNIKSRKQKAKMSRVQTKTQKLPQLRQTYFNMHFPIFWKFWVWYLDFRVFQLLFTAFISHSTISYSSTTILFSLLLHNFPFPPPQFYFPFFTSSFSLLHVIFSPPQFYFPPPQFYFSSSTNLFSLFCNFIFLPL